MRLRDSDRTRVDEARELLERARDRTISQLEDLASRPDRNEVGALARTTRGQIAGELELARQLFQAPEPLRLQALLAP